MIDEQLVVIEIQIREDLVLVEQVITDGGLREQIALLHVQLLPMTAQEKEELRLQRRSQASAIEVGEKRIVCVLEQRGRVEPRRETFGEVRSCRHRLDLLSRYTEMTWVRGRAFAPDAACYHREPMYKATIAVCIALNVAACASVPPASSSAGAVPVVTWEQKLGWIVRLEDQRILRDPNPPSPVILKPATQREPALVAPGPPSDLVKLLNDNEARVERRAALAIGRVGLSEGIEPLTVSSTTKRSKSGRWRRSGSA